MPRPDQTTYFIAKHVLEQYGYQFPRVQNPTYSRQPSRGIKGLRLYCVITPDKKKIYMTSKQLGQEASKYLNDFTNKDNT